MSNPPSRFVFYTISDFFFFLRLETRLSLEASAILVAYIYNFMYIFFSTIKKHNEEVIDIITFGAISIYRLQST